MTSGIIVLDKASGISSAKAIAQVKRKLDLKKIGHAGTLDPAATGILICLVNDATKLARSFEGGRKTYRGIMKLGVVTTTDDLDGEVISRSTAIPPFERIREASREFVGIIEQKPPVVSAVKVNGVRAYEVFRSTGDIPTLKSRTVTVHAFDLAPGDAPDEVSYAITCGSGTYIRSIARDLGERLGCGCCIGTLRRTASAPFEEHDAKKIDEISERDIRNFSEIEGVLCRH